MLYLLHKYSLSLMMRLLVLTYLLLLAFMTCSTFSRANDMSINKKDLSSIDKKEELSTFTYSSNKVFSNNIDYVNSINITLSKSFFSYFKIVPRFLENYIDSLSCFFERKQDIRIHITKFLSLIIYPFHVFW